MSYHQTSDTAISISSPFTSQHHSSPPHTNQLNITYLRNGFPLLATLGALAEILAFPADALPPVSCALVRADQLVQVSG